MENRQLGKSGLQVSVVGLGANNFGRRVDAKQTEAVIRQAVEVGVNLIDTANSYGDGLSEEYIGKDIKGIKDQVIIATKVGGSMGEGPNQKGASRKHILEQVEISLKRLDLEYLDLYQIHFPDLDTPIEETMRVLNDLVHQGKVRYIGCSNFAAWQVSEAIWTSKVCNLAPFISAQPEYSLLKRDVEKELIPFCRAYDIGILPYFPLASGFLTGKYRPGESVPEGTRLAGNPRSQQRYLTEGNFAILTGLERFAEERGHTIGELAIAWLLANPLVSSVIAGATKPEQVVANARASDWRLSADDMAEIDKFLQGDSTG